MLIIAGKINVAGNFVTWREMLELAGKVGKRAGNGSMLFVTKLYLSFSDCELQTVLIICQLWISCFMFGLFAYVY